MLLNDQLRVLQAVRDNPILEPADDPAAPGVLDDAVDEVIEHVLAHDGRVTFVPDGALADRGRVALALRY